MKHGEETHFKIKKTTPLKKLMDAYGSKKGIDPARVVFTFDGVRLNASTDSNKTAAEVGLEDGDMIETKIHQTGGY